MHLDLSQPVPSQLSITARREKVGQQMSMIIESVLHAGVDVILGITNH